MDTMDDLKARSKAFFDEVEFVHLKKNWVERIVELGIDERDTSMWAAEIGHVVDEFESRLRDLFDTLAVSDPERIPVEVYGWAVGVSEVTVPEIEEPMRYLEGLIEKHLPPDYFDIGDE